VGSLGTYVSAGSILLVMLISALGYIWRRQGKEARHARRTRETNIASLTWHYQVQALAAIRGWNSDPAWPKTPYEMTAEYIAGIAKEDSDERAAELAGIAEALGKVK
jgi:hypothetical protein